MAKRKVEVFLEEDQVEAINRLTKNRSDWIREAIEEALEEKGVKNMKQNVKDYLKSVLTPEQFEELREDKVIIIKGSQGKPTGKTTLRMVLRLEGFTVYESWEVMEIEMNNALREQDPLFLSKLMENKYRKQRKIKEAQQCKDTK